MLKKSILGAIIALGSFSLISAYTPTTGDEQLLDSIEQRVDVIIEAHSDEKIDMLLSKVKFVLTKIPEDTQGHYVIGNFYDIFLDALALDDADVAMFTPGERGKAMKKKAKAMRDNEDDMDEDDMDEDDMDEDDMDEEDMDEEDMDEEDMDEEDMDEEDMDEEDMDEEDMDEDDMDDEEYSKSDKMRAAAKIKRLAAKASRATMEDNDDEDEDDDMDDEEDEDNEEEDDEDGDSEDEDEEDDE